MLRPKRSILTPSFGFITDFFPKTFRYFYLILCLILFIGCNSDSDEDITISNNENGKLKATIDGREVVFNDVFVNIIDPNDSSVELSAESIDENGNTEKITIVVNNENGAITEGIYNIVDNDFDAEFASYSIRDTNDNLIVFTTLNSGLTNDNPASGQVNITNLVTSFDPPSEGTSSQTITGSFEFQAFRNQDTESITITNGTFTDLKAGNN